MPSTPGTINYPTALDDLISLVEAANVVRETLTAGVSASDLLIPVTNIGKFSNSGIATLLDHPTAPTLRENFVYTSKSGGNLVVPAGGRGSQGTSAAAFSTGATVAQRPTQLHHKVLADAIRALEAKLGIDASTPGAAAQALMSNGAGKSIWRALTGADIPNVVRTDLATQQQIISNLLLAKDSPFIILQDNVGGSGSDFVLNCNGGSTNIGRSGQNDLLLNNSNGVYTFGQKPLLPGVDPTLANEAARKAYVDGRQTRWCAAFIYPDISTKAVDPNFDQIQGALIPGSNFTCTHVYLKVVSGTNTGAFIVEFRKLPFNSMSQTNLGSINYNPGLGGTIGVGIESAITPHTFSANDFIYPVVTAVAGPQQKMVWVGFRGFQTPQ